MPRPRPNPSRPIHATTADLFEHRRTNGASTEPSVPSAPPDDELWSVRIVVARTGLARSTIYAYVKQGLFPRQRRLGPGRVGWRASEVRAWIAGRPLAST